MLPRYSHLRIHFPSPPFPSLQELSCSQWLSSKFCPAFSWSRFSSLTHSPLPIPTLVLVLAAGMVTSILVEGGFPFSFQAFISSHALKLTTLSCQSWRKPLQQTPGWLLLSLGFTSMTVSSRFFFFFFKSSFLVKC